MNNIEILEELIQRCKECKFACCEQCEINNTQVRAIENLIKRNKELEEENIKYPIKMNNEQYNKTINNAQKELKQELERQINAREITEKYIDKNFIETSKLKEKIEDYDKMIKATYSDITSSGDYRRNVCFEIRKVLQELLEEGE